MSILITPRLRPVLLSVATAASLSMLAACARDPAPTAPAASTSAAVVAKTEAARIYVCPMHPHITSNAPGRCTEFSGRSYSRQ